MRELVALVLRSKGIETARPRVVQRRLSERIMEDYRGDVLGVPGWLVSTRADISPRFGPALDSARQTASLAGIGRAVVVQYRDAVPVEDFTVTMSLATFANLVVEQGLPG